LGGAVAVSLAHRYPDEVFGIIIENTFLSISSMVDKLMPYVSIFKHLILRIKWDSDEKIKDLKQPILFISGDSDELVPPTHMKALYDFATKSVHRDFYSVLGGRHNDTWDVAGRAYYEVSRAH
jgi:pimeloyl-ACP methyl ester carboxylesterase